VTVGAKRDPIGQVVDGDDGHSMAAGRDRIPNIPNHPSDYEEYENFVNFQIVARHLAGVSDLTVYQYNMGGSR